MPSTVSYRKEASVQLFCKKDETEKWKKRNIVLEKQDSNDECILKIRHQTNSIKRWGCLSNSTLIEVYPSSHTIIRVPSLDEKANVAVLFPMEGSTEDSCLYFAACNGAKNKLDEFVDILYGVCNVTTYEVSIESGQFIPLGTALLHIFKDTICLSTYKVSNIAWLQKWKLISVSQFKQVKHGIFIYNTHSPRDEDSFVFLYTSHASSIFNRICACLKQSFSNVLRNLEYAGLNHVESELPLSLSPSLIPPFTSSLSSLSSSSSSLAASSSSPQPSPKYGCDINMNDSSFATTMGSHLVGGLERVTLTTEDDRGPQSTLTQNRDDLKRCRSLPQQARDPVKKSLLESSKSCCLHNRIHSPSHSRRMQNSKSSVKELVEIRFPKRNGRNPHKRSCSESDLVLEVLDRSVRTQVPKSRSLDAVQAKRRAYVEGERQRRVTYLKTEDDGCKVDPRMESFDNKDNSDDVLELEETNSSLTHMKASDVEKERSEVVCDSYNSWTLSCQPEGHSGNVMDMISGQPNSSENLVGDFDKYLSITRRLRASQSSESNMDATTTDAPESPQCANDSQEITIPSNDISSSVLLSSDSPPELPHRDQPESEEMTPCANLELRPRCYIYMNLPDPKKALEVPDTYVNVFSGSSIRGCYENWEHHSKAYERCQITFEEDRDPKLPPPPLRPRAPPPRLPPREKPTGHKEFIPEIPARKISSPERPPKRPSKLSKSHSDQSGVNQLLLENSLEESPRIQVSLFASQPISGRVWFLRVAFMHQDNGDSTFKRVRDIESASGHQLRKSQSLEVFTDISLTVQPVGKGFQLLNENSQDIDLSDVKNLRKGDWFVIEFHIQHLDKEEKQFMGSVTVCPKDLPLGNKGPWSSRATMGINEVFQSQDDEDSCAQHRLSPHHSTKQSKLIPDYNKRLQLCKALDITISSQKRDWRLVAGSLGFTLTEITELHDKAHRCCDFSPTDAMLRLWEERDASCTLERLVNVLREIGRLDVVQDLGFSITLENPVDSKPDISGKMFTLELS